MTTSPALRWFWRVYIPAALLALLAMLSVPFAPSIETMVDPVRVEQSISDVRRLGAMLRFVWNSRKLRMAPSDDVDVVMWTPRDHFPLTIYNDLSPPGAPCTVLVPWSQGQVVDVAVHHQPYCIQVPIIVQPTDRIRVQVIAHYRGFGGLWDLPVRFPEIAVDPAPP